MIETLEKILGDQGDLILFAYLFGSKALGTDSVTSDTDLAVYVNPKYQDQWFDIKTNLYLILSRALKTNDLDIVILNQCENIMLLDRIIADGKILHDTDRQTRLYYEQKILHAAIDFKTQRKKIMGV